MFFRKTCLFPLVQVYFEDGWIGITLDICRISKLLLLEIRKIIRAISYMIHENKLRRIDTQFFLDPDLGYQGYSPSCSIEFENVRLPASHRVRVRFAKGA